MRSSSPISSVGPIDQSRRVDRPRASAPSVRQRMQTTGRRDTPPELRVRSLLHRNGYRFRVDVSPVSATRSRADIVFPRLKFAIYIDGCFWHGCAQHGTWPKANGDWWRHKIETNRNRDVANTTILMRSGWTVIRVWEHEDPDIVVETIIAALRSRMQQFSAGTFGTGPS
jgi:DNA mismatch endonuclease, patch repair protein